LTTEPRRVAADHRAPATPPNMLLRLSRASFWLAASVAAVALWVPTGQETLLTGVVLVASTAALLLWRQGVRQRTLTQAMPWVPSQAQALSEAALRDAAATIARVALAAPSFEAALHAVARLLKSELGARDVTAHQVLELGPTQARVARLIASLPELRFDERCIRLDASPLGECIAQQRERGEPARGIAVPVVRSGRVVAALELTGIAIAIESGALARLLALTRLTLGEWEPARSMPASRPEVHEAGADGRPSGVPTGGVA